ncbi:MAG: flagellin [Alteromonadaceae bacterium]|nr:MAG: flagellin [Alteromonadaceae bacterium]
MPLVVNTNVGSINAQRQLVSSGAELDKASTRLTSGLRINSAADDAAGLAISNRQTSQIRGLDQAVRNANDGISLIQTAEGALGETTNILQRMRELSIQSANGIYDDTDRASLDAEVQQLVSELDRIAETTAFNGQNILDGSQGEIKLQVGAQANQTIAFKIDAVDADTLGMGSISADVVGATMAALGSQLALDEQDILINGQAVGAIESTDTLNDITTQISENINGVTASAVVQINGTAVGTGVVGTGGVQFAVVGGDGLTTTYNVANTESLQELADEIGKATGGIISGTVNDDGSLSISAEGVRSITVTDADSTTGLSVAAVQSQIILTSDNGDEVTIERGQTGNNTNIESFGFRESRESGVIQGIGLVVNSGGANEALSVGDLSINGVEVGVTDTSSLAGKIDAINDITDQTGVKAEAFSSIVIDTTTFEASATIGATEGMRVNGVDGDLNIVSTDTVTDFAEKFNAVFSNATGVTARVKGTDLVLESSQGQITLAGNTSTAEQFIGSAVGLETITQTYISSGGTFVESTNATIDSSDVITAVAGLQLTSENGNPISVEFGDNRTNAAIQSSLGLRESNTLGEGSFGSAVSSITIDTAANAQKAIGVIDNALESVNASRSKLGAANNRLDFTISNLSNVSQNTSAARSRILDADFASETAKLSRAQVLQQASQAMLAQANARPQQVLSLLQ